MVRRYERAAMIVAVPIVKDYHTAEDVIQDSFMIAYRSVNALRDGSRFGPWMLRITRREAMRQARKRRVTLSIHVTVDPAVPEDTIRPPDRYEQLIRLINRLPAHERLVVTLHHLDGHPTGAIATITGRPVGTVTKQLSRGIRRLRQWLQKQEFVS
ncbi:MAG: hypothetical protein A2W31_16630 [Planctomycetes bacterium RBG_16_64_10]|nr:MAG: hypothetical protein A2W31_16630 [Planctomycetes bacterium RBG_16_64_10]